MLATSAWWPVLTWSYRSRLLTATAARRRVAERHGRLGAATLTTVSRYGARGARSGRWQADPPEARSAEERKRRGSTARSDHDPSPPKKAPGTGVAAPTPSLSSPQHKTCPTATPNPTGHDTRSV